MLGVLYVSHGTRVKEGLHQANHFLQKCMLQVHVPIQKVCYLELVRPNIQEGIRRCVAAGVRTLLVQPLLLLTAGHAKRDIPGEIDKARKKYPHVHFICGRPFGVDDIIIHLLIERLHEKQQNLPERYAILLVGRGSSDPDTKRDFAAIRRLLLNKGIPSVIVCYMAAASPSFQEGLERVVREKRGQTFVIPYLLFTGVLMKTISRSVREKNEAGAAFVLCRPLGYHPALIQLMKKRIRESLQDVPPHYA